MRPLVAILTFLSILGYPLVARGQSASDSALHAARLTGEWTFELRVAARPQACSPAALEGASTQTTVIISDSSGSFWGLSGLAGSTRLTWDWLGRAPSNREGRFNIAQPRPRAIPTPGWTNDSVVFTIDYVWTHDGGMYGRGRLQGDSIVGTWEQAGYCPTPSGTFVLRRSGRTRGIPRGLTPVPSKSEQAPEAGGSRGGSGAPGRTTTARGAVGRR
jgi:hypothetical protein